MIGDIAAARAMGWLGTLGVLGTLGCRMPPAVEPADDRLTRGPVAGDPCAVKQDPDILVKGTPPDLLTALSENMAFLRKANPLFLCGLERIEVLGDAEYEASADPKYTRRSVGLYTASDRVIHLKASAGITLTHETGHHIQNLEYFAPTVREFLSLTWRWSDRSEIAPLCSGYDCFVSDAAASSPGEDWARTFEMVLMRPIETGALTNFSLASDGPTPAQKKTALIRSIASVPAPAQAALTFGPATALSAGEAAKKSGLSHAPALPSSFSPEETRRIFLQGKRAVRSYVWERRRRPFLSGHYLVFPAFQEAAKRMGFFAYDLTRRAFVAMDLSAGKMPSEIRSAADSVQDIEILPQDDGTLLFFALLKDGTALETPVAFGWKE